MQWDVFGREILHVDFARVSSDERVTLEIPITLKGNAPGANEGGVLDQPMHSIEIECPATNIQESIIVNISGLHLDQAIYVRDLKFQEGVTTSEDPDQIVVHVIRAAGEEELEIAGEGSAEPELIRREKAASDEEE
jgi:large subunit ribosomal protein L25